MHDPSEGAIVEDVGTYYGLRDSNTEQDLFDALDHALANADQCEVFELVLIAMEQLGRLERSPAVCHLVERAKAAWLQRLGIVSPFA